MADWNEAQLYVIKEIERLADETRELRKKQHEVSVDVKSLCVSQAELSKTVRRTVHFRASIMGALSGFLTILATFFFEYFNRK